MKRFQRVIPALLLSLLWGCSNNATVTPVAAPAGLEHSGSFTIREDHVMRLAAGTYGEGTLLLHGWEHRFEFSGAKINVAGTRDVEIHGTVFNLENAEDFQGTYHPVKLEIKAGDGLQGVWAQNDKGVTIHVITKGVGENYSLNLEAKGATITLVN